MSLVSLDLLHGTSVRVGWRESNRLRPLRDERSGSPRRVCNPFQAGSVASRRWSPVRSWVMWAESWR